MARPGFTNHRKFRRLSRALGGEALARGSLELLWDTAYENGDDYIGQSDDVEAAARWNGEPGMLTRELLAAGGDGNRGFIDEVSGRPGHYLIHDLYDHAPEYVRKRMSREAARRAAGTTISEIRAAAARQRHSRGKQIVACVEQTEGNGDQLQPFASTCHANGTTPAPAPAPARAPANTLPQTTFADGRVESSRAKNSNPTEEQVEQIYRLYPKKRDKLAAKKAIRKAAAVVTAGDVDHPAMSITEALDYLAQRIRLYSECTRGVDPQFIPYPASWFNAGGFWDDEKDWSLRQQSRRNGLDMKLPPNYVPASEKVRQGLRQRSAGGMQ